MQPEAAAYLVDVARRAREVLGDRLVGVWLAGSAALDEPAATGAEALHVHAVTAGRVPLADRERLAHVLDHAELACPGQGLEFALYAREDLDAPGGPAFQLRLATGPARPTDIAFDARADPRHRATVDVAIARQRGVPLAGPPAADVLPALPADLVGSALQDALDEHARADGASVQALLAACRAWAWATDGEWRSGEESAHWAMERLADPAPVERALRLRDGEGTLPPSPGEVNAVLAAARGALQSR